MGEVVKFELQGFNFSWRLSLAGIPYLTLGEPPAFATPTAKRCATYCSTCAKSKDIALRLQRVKHLFTGWSEFDREVTALAAMAASLQDLQGSE